MELASDREILTSGGFVLATRRRNRGVGRGRDVKLEGCGGGYTSNYSGVAGARRLARAAVGGVAAVVSCSPPMRHAMRQAAMEAVVAVAATAVQVAVATTC